MYVKKNVTRCECGGSLRYNEEAGETTTMVGRIPEGNHWHNANCITRFYTCEECGVTYLISRRNSCNECDWRGHAECTICGGGPKVDKWPDEV